VQVTSQWLFNQPIALSVQDLKAKGFEAVGFSGIQATSNPPAPTPDMSLSRFLDRLTERSSKNSAYAKKTTSLYFGNTSENAAIKPENQFDVVIVGAGPAGVSAAIYAVRRKLKTLLIDKAPVIGGYVANTAIIENYPADYSVTGTVLAKRYTQRLNQLNDPESGLNGLLTIRLGKAVGKIAQTPTETESEQNFKIKIEGESDELQSRAVIIATGVNRKKVPIKRFQELLNKGVSMCTICDGPLYKNKDVAIIGHNQAAVDAALYMATLANKVYFVASKSIEATPETLAALRQHPKVSEVLENTAVTEFIGTQRLESMVIKVKNQPARTIPLHGAFLETDLVSSAKFATGLVALDEQGQVVVDDNLSSGPPGLYAAGDVTPVKYKQITIAEGQGAAAALRAAEYLQGKDIKADYGKNATRTVKSA
jgi:thioredoxin reductase